MLKEKSKVPDSAVPSSSCLQQNPPIKQLGDIIGKIAHSTWKVKSTAKIDDLALELEKNPKIISVGVVDEYDRPIGVIVRSELLNHLSRKFGRDVYKFKQVTDLMIQVPVFNAKKNVFGIANQIGQNLDKTEAMYYLLLNDDDSFYGIFSSFDVLVYLSEITKQDLELAKKIQKKVVREEEIIENDQFEFVGTSKMAKGVGGDYYAIRNISRHEWWVILCDVSGKGISASLITTIIDGMLSVFDNEKGIKSFIKSLNRYIADTFKLEKFVTGIFLAIDEKSGRVKFYDMGHCMGSSNAYIIRNDKFMILANKNYNLALGIYPDIPVKHDNFDLEKGDLILLITDGLTDQRNSRNEEIGIKPTAKIILANQNKPLKIAKDKIMDMIHEYKGTSTQIDDISFILLRYRK